MWCVPQNELSRVVREVGRWERWPKSEPSTEGWERSSSCSSGRVANNFMIEVRGWAVERVCGVEERWSERMWLLAAFRYDVFAVIG
jgi:hypothetical protein